MVRPVSTSPALDPWEHVARTFEPARPSRWPTPGALARHLNPRTIQTPALDLIDQDLVEAATTPDARLIITMAPQEGKALALDTPVPTPTGWTTMGALTVGDQVIGGDGRPCRVTWVSPTWTGRDCYAVTTGDGERIVADAAHEWVAKLDRRRSARIVETTDLAKVRSKAAQITTAQQGLDLPEADLPLDPYVLGVWLGDGTTGKAAITCHPGDVAIRDRFAAAGWPLRHLGRMCWTMTPEAPNGTYGRGKPSPAKAALRAAGVLTNKHIPIGYLRASRAQRLALLQGLIDSDGYVMPKGQVEFCSINTRLAEDVRELVYSLGAKAVVGVSRATIDGRDCGPKYRVRFYLAAAAHLPRKAQRCKDSSVSQLRYVRAAPCESVPTVCIEVDSDDHTFLAGRTMLPTHNSVRAAGDFPLWMLTRNPDLRIIVASYGQGLANRNGRGIRNRITANPELGLRIAPDNGAVGEWTIDGHEGGVYSVGIGGGITGRACDCISGDMRIESEYGPITAREAFERGVTRILAYDHTTGTPVWRKVEASRRISGRRVITVITKSGRRLVCTPDHRIHTSRGYVPAGSLRPGETLVGLVALGGMPPMRQPACGTEAIPTTGNRSWAHALLLRLLRAGRDVRVVEDPEAVSAMWRQDASRASGDLLLGSVPVRSTNRACAPQELPAMLDRVPPKNYADGVLLSLLRQRSARRSYARHWELAIHYRHLVCEMVSSYASINRGARWGMRGLLEGARADVRSLGARNDSLSTSRPSHQRGRAGQPGGELDSSLPDLSLGSPQVEDDTVSVVLDGSDTAVDVYDFQVEGTHNFFAEGILVHNCMIIDDPIKSRAEADSEIYRDRVWDWWTDEASARLAPGAPVVLILTRWHHADLAGRLIAQGGWTVLNIPAQCDDPATDPLGRAEGEFMVSTRGRTREQWELRKRTAGTRTWASLYQGRPTPDTGNLFPSDGWARYDRPLWLVRDDGARIVPDAMRDPDVEIIQSWDLAFKDTESSDYVVGQVWMRRGTQAFLLDQIRRRMGFTESCQAMLDMTARWPQAIAKLVEDKANGPAVMNALRAKVGGLIPVEPEGSKYARAVAITPLVEAHDVVLPDPVAVEGTAWVTDLTEEARDFPGASHDDTVDGMSQAVHRLLLVPMLAGQTLYPEDVLGDGVELDWVADLDY